MMKRQITALVTVLGVGLTMATLPAVAQEAKKPEAKAPEQVKRDKGTQKPLAEANAITPLPLEAIPDNPPPHEGAMIDLTYRIQAPDILLVEVLEALPGRAITGEHMVRPDGTISLGFYGEVHVTGLTLRQAKAKITLHLRAYLKDETLGLVEFVDADERLEPLKPAGTIVPPPKGQELAPAQEEEKPADKETRKAARLKKKAKAEEAVVVPDNQPKPERVAEGKTAYIAVAPEDSRRVFVDVAAYNSAVYYVLGIVNSPGRLPCTGRETVLDALQYAGGLRNGYASPTFVLHRPARGDTPKHEYPLDIEAIYKGDTKANLQIFPGDRLVVYGKSESAVVEKKK